VPVVPAAPDAASTGRSVLLVEDDDDLAEVVSTLLGHEGFAVARATSAAEAVAHGEEQAPDVIVLDIRLRDGSGADVVAAFRRRWSLAQTPVVVYSVLDVPAEEREDLQLGRTVFLTKGHTSPEQLRDRVVDLVRVSAGATDSVREDGPDGTHTH